MIAGLEDITAGEVRLGDAVVTDLPPKDRDIAMVFQNYALYPHMSAYDNMAFALKMRGLPKAEIDRRVTSAARGLGREGPLSNLDGKLRVEMRAEIARIQRDLEVTTIYVTHDQVEAMTMGDRVCVMRGGFLQQAATPQEL